MPAFNGPPPYTSWTITSDTIPLDSAELRAQAAVAQANDRALQYQKVADQRAKEADRLRVEVTRLRGCIEDGEKLAREIQQAHIAGWSSRPKNFGPSNGPPPGTSWQTGNAVASNARLAILSAQMERLIAATAEAVTREGQAVTVPAPIVSEVRARVREAGTASAVAKAQAARRGPSIVCQGDYWE